MSNKRFRYVKAMAVLLGIVFGAALPASAETPSAETPSVVVTPVEAEPTIRSAAELEELVAPIALYPDDLLAVALPASTYPVQIVQAARLLETVQAGSTVTPDEAWDDSVVALMNYPEVVQLMDRDLDWTWKLGDAVLNQQADVLNAVERFRTRAHAAGNLKTDGRQVVTVTPEAIQIAPADPQVIYVPYYEPARVTVYQRVPVYHYYPVGYPVYYYPYPFGYTFDSGYFWGVTSVYRLGWHTHHVHVHPYYSHYHPYYGHRYYNHYYRQPWRGWNDNRHQHTSYWNRNDHNGSGWNSNHQNGRDFDRNRGNFDRSDMWRHDRSRGGARQHNRNRFERDGRQHESTTTLASARNRFDRSGGTARNNDQVTSRRDGQRDANRFPLPTDRTAFRNSAPDIRTRQANERVEAQSGPGERRNQQARAGLQNQRADWQRQRNQDSRERGASALGNSRQRGASAPVGATAFRADQPNVRAGQARAPAEARRDFQRPSFDAAQAQRTQRQQQQQHMQRERLQRERQRPQSAAVREPQNAAPPTANRQRFETARRDNRGAENRRQNAPQFRSAENSQGRREQSRSAPPQQARPMVAQAPREQRSNDGASRQRFEGRQRDGNRGSERHEARGSSSSEGRGRGFGSRRHD